MILNQKIKKSKNQLILTTKKLALSLTLLSASYNAYSQTDLGSMRLNAKDGQGFIVMNQPKSTSYSCWRYVFSERTGISTPRNSNGIVQLDNITVCGKNYISLPKSYRYDRKKDIIVSVYGVTKLSEVQVLKDVRIGNYTGPTKIAGGDANPLFRCGAVCDGNLYQGQSYAYALNVYERATLAQPTGTGQTYLALETVNSSFINGEIVVPYFGYYTVAQANNWASVRTAGTMNIENYKAEYYDYQISPMLNTDQLAPGVVIRDPSGTPIGLHTDYYMIKKDLGPFEHDNGLQTANYTSWGTDCNNGVATLNGFITYFNNYAVSKPSNFVPLVCFGNGYSVSTESQEGGESPCGEETYNSFNQDMDVWEIAQWLAGCNPIGDPTVSQWATEWELSSVINVGGTTKPVYTSNSEFAKIGEKLTLPADLYRLKVSFSNGTYKELIIEAKQTYNYTASIKDLVAPRIFPVPIVGDKYTVQLESNIATMFMYELFDGNGINILTRKMEVGVTNGTPYDISISSDVAIPSGTLIHKFTFMDGSVRTINTIK